jgi:hypothetical protein
LDAGGNVDASVCIKVSLLKDGSGEVGYSQIFSASCCEWWPDQSVVPRSFYVALDKVVGDFLDDWRKSGAAENLKRWSPGVMEPKLRSMTELEKIGSVYLGRCVVDCNGYDKRMAIGWAEEHLKDKCRQTLRTSPERVRIAYDKQSFDGSGSARTLSLEFRTFECVDMVMTFDKGEGFVAGDTDIMGGGATEALVEKLRRYVRAEMVRTGNISEADVDKIKFGRFTIDNYGVLITGTFRLDLSNDAICRPAWDGSKENKNKEKK